ncbi:MAG: homoserine dehydrogenase [Lachnospiraceae bacterium]|nr:homoserine dehydrogenase [Lachnospiraceae bacterium]
MAKIAILGYGTVGSGVAHVLDENVPEVTGSAGEAVSVKSILDLREFPGDPHEAQVTHEFREILEDPEITVVCETMGGVKPAYDFTKQLLEAGKSVCTSNKELVAKHGPELAQIARDHRVSYLFEASVGGGIPILRTLAGALASERIDLIEGILNGTTNYILTKMEEDGSSFDAVLKQAQELGYAERDPAADIEGHDACRKIAILGSLATGAHVNAEAVPTEGITKITADDLKMAGQLGMTVKLLGSVKIGAEGLEILVAPFLVPLSHPLASVRGVFNAIAVHGNMLGTSMYYGQGAGKDATASAVVADVCEIVRNAGRTVPVSLQEREVKLIPTGEAVRRFFVSMDHAGEAGFQGLFQDGQAVSSGDAAGILTAPMKESTLVDKVAGFGDRIHWMRVAEA